MPLTLERKIYAAAAAGSHWRQCEAPGRCHARTLCRRRRRSCNAVTRRQYGRNAASYTGRQGADNTCSSAHTASETTSLRVLRQLHWLPVQRRVEFKIACLAHQSLTSTTPTYLSADIQLVSEHGRRHLHSSSCRTLAVPCTRTTLGDRNLTVAGPRVWNSLPATIRQITSYEQFRQQLKTHLFMA